MQIIHVTRRFTREAWGGTESVVLAISQALTARGHRNEILCSSALSTPGHDVVEGIPVCRTPYFYPYLGLEPSDRRALDLKGGNPFSVSMARALASRPTLDLLHLHTGKRLGGIDRVVARARRIPYVVTLHGGHFDVPDEERRTWTAPTRHALEWGKVLGWCVGSRRVLRDAAAVICVGRGEYRHASRQLPNTRVEQIPNGVDVARFERGNGHAIRDRFRIPRRASLLLTVARIDPQKSQHLAVAVVETLRREGRDVHLLLVGPVTDEDYHRRLLAQIRHVGLASRVHVIPGCAPDSHDLVDAYHAADLFLLPSVHEPFGIVILEAWAAGLPVVARRVGGIPDFADHETDCLLFDADADGGPLRHVRTVLSSTDLSRRLADAGHRKAREQFTWSRTATRLETLYEEVRHAHSVRDREGRAPWRRRAAHRRYGHGAARPGTPVPARVR